MQKEDKEVPVDGQTVLELRSSEKKLDKQNRQGSLMRKGSNLLRSSQKKGLGRLSSRSEPAESETPHSLPSLESERAELKVLGRTLEDS